MTDRGLDSWTVDRSARERGREIATTLTAPRSVEWVRKRAQVSSWQTTNDELEMLVEFGQVHAVDGDDGNRKYAPNYQLRDFYEVTELINGHARDELREEIATSQEAIDEWKAEFDVESRNDLESTLAEKDLATDAIRDRNSVLRSGSATRTTNASSRTRSISTRTSGNSTPAGTIPPARRCHAHSRARHDLPRQPGESR